MARQAYAALRLEAGMAREPVVSGSGTPDASAAADVSRGGGLRTGGATDALLESDLAAEAARKGGATSTLPEPFGHRSASDTSEGLAAQRTEGHNAHAAIADAGRVLPSVWQQGAPLGNDASGPSAVPAAVPAPCRCGQHAHLLSSSHALLWVLYSCVALVLLRFFSRRLFARVRSKCEKV